jgi:hypothetical protein
MANTGFEDIYKIFLNSIQDYRIKRLFEEEPSVADDMLCMFLETAVSKFVTCRKPIMSTDFNSNTFACELDLEEKIILKDCMILAWMEWVINDITQMNWALNDNDFKHYSEEKNLREKSEYTDRLREKVYQAMLDYDITHTPFADWGMGNFEL